MHCFHVDCFVTEVQLRSQDNTDDGTDCDGGTDWDDDDGTDCDGDCDGVQLNWLQCYMVPASVNKTDHAPSLPA